MEKIADIREKALELSGIIQKMKTYDIGEDILQRWEGENERLLKKLDEDEKTALDVSDVNLDQEQNELPPKQVNNGFMER